MNETIDKLAKAIAYQGLSFVEDGKSLKLVMEELNKFCYTCSPERQVEYLTASLKVLDEMYKWQTKPIRSDETDAQRQAREDSLYRMFAQLWVYSKLGVRVGL